jgi:hypothetical protein
LPMNSRFRVWITNYVVMLVLLCFSVAAITYLVDPMWCFTHSNLLNSRQLPFDERQQKSDYLVARPSVYNALMLGSSRVTVIDQRDIKGFTAFNGSVNAMMPDEYANYADFAKRHNRGEFRLIILGADFFGSNANFKGYGQKTPDYYFRNAESRWYRFRTLFTWDALYYSYRNVRQLFSPTTHHHYDRNNIKMVMPISPKFREMCIAKDLAEFDRYLYGKTYRYHDIKPQLTKLREQNASSRFVVFTTPDSKPLWDYLVHAGRLEDYLLWLGDLVDVFGEVYDFMGENKLTSNLENYQDAHHLTPHAAGKLVERILDNSPENRLGAGTLLTRDNYQAYAEKVRARYADPKH